MGQTSIATSIPQAQETLEKRFQKKLEKWMVVLCSDSFQNVMAHNGKSFANTQEVKKPHKALGVPETSRIHKAPFPGDVTAMSYEKRLSSCQSCLPRPHIRKNRLRSHLRRISHMVRWQCSLCKQARYLAGHTLRVFLFALVLAPPM